MLGTILRSRALAFRSRSFSTARFSPALFIATRSSILPAVRAFSISPISREYEYDDRRGARSSDYAREPRQRTPRNPPSPVVWVGNLPWTCTAQEIEELFNEFGTITSIRLGLTPSGESRGFAHVDFDDVKTAESIMKANTEAQFFLDGRGLFLDYASPPPPLREFPPTQSLHFTNFSGDEELLKLTFKEFEDVIQDLRIMRNPQTNESSRYGFIEFATVEDATAALQKFNGKEIAYGEALKLSYSRGKRDQSRSDRGREGSGYGRGSGRRDYGGGRGRGFDERGPPQRSEGNSGGYNPQRDYRGRRETGGWSPRGNRGQGNYSDRSRGRGGDESEGSY